MKRFVEGEDRFQSTLFPETLDDLTPWEYLAKHSLSENSNYTCN